MYDIRYVLDFDAGGIQKTCQKEASGKMRVVKVRVGILRVEAQASVRLVRYF